MSASICEGGGGGGGENQVEESSDIEWRSVRQKQSVGAGNYGM